jgi:hypothetical protein
MTTGRHPLHQAADKLKIALLEQGFELVDNGEGHEVEKHGVTFPTWAEPKEFFAWQSDPLETQLYQSILRTRILPGSLRRMRQLDKMRHLKQLGDVKKLSKLKNLEELEDFEKQFRLGNCQLKRLLTFGRVYQNDKNQPMHYQIEGLLLDDTLKTDGYEDLWNRVASNLFGAGATATLDAVDDLSYRINITDPAEGKVYQLGYTGPASEETLSACQSEGGFGWVFIINVDDFALQVFSLKDTAQLYKNNLHLLTQFPNEVATVGDSPAYRAIEALRQLGYHETCGDVLYTDKTYKKMNMIQAAWDRNNQGYRLVEELGDYTATRTVLTPALEQIMGYNYKQGVKALRVFEVGHIFMPQESELLPKEHIAISMGAYGPDVNIESFQRDVTVFLAAMGIENPKYLPNSMATAYKWNECQIIMYGEEYLQSNFGRIHKKAAKNHDIGCAAYMANFELKALVDALEPNDDDDYDEDDG